MASISDNINLIGKYVNLREVNVKDAEFILSLRCNENKSKFLHSTEYDIEKQRKYIEAYFDKNEYYFIAENKEGQTIGTIRIYEITENTFTIGSWLMIDNLKPEEVVESEFLCRMYGFETLKKTLCVYDVRKENKKVIRYHKMVGAKIVGQTELDYLFECTKEDYLKNIEKYLYSIQG